MSSRRSIRIGCSDSRVPAYQIVGLLDVRSMQCREHPFVAAIERVAIAMLDDLVRDLRVGAIAVVGSSDRDLAKTGNPHIRAHEMAATAAWLPLTGK